MINYVFRGCQNVLSKKITEKLTLNQRGNTHAITRFMNVSEKKGNRRDEKGTKAQGHK
jgi:hypothetical protein